MQIRSASSSRSLRFEFDSDTQRQNLFGQLERGQALEARVLDRVADGRWAVRVLGHTLVAESRLPLLPGQVLQARVESLGPPLTLSILDNIASGEPAALGRALQDLGLADDPLTRAVVRGMVDQGLAVSRGEVLSLRDHILSLGLPLNLNDLDELSDVASRALFLQSRGLPVTPDTLSASLAHLPPAALGGLLESLSDLLRSLRLPGFDKSESAAWADRIQAAMPRAGELTGETLKTLVDALGLDLEGRLAAWIAGGNSGLPDGLDDTLKALLLQLRDRLDGLDSGSLNPADRRALGALQSRLGETLRLFTTLQVVNLPAGPRQYLYLQIPFLLSGRPSAADLRVACREEGGRRRVDPDNLRLSLSLDLTGLGPIRIDLNVADRRAVCNIGASDEQKAAFFQEASDTLKTALENCGYAVSSILCHTLKDRRDGGPGGLPPIGLDLRA